MDENHELELRWLKTRVSALEQMMAYLMRRLGGEERLVVDWLKKTELRGEVTYLYGAVNSLLNSLKPPPRR